MVLRSFHLGARYECWQDRAKTSFTAQVFQDRLQLARGSNKRQARFAASSCGRCCALFTSSTPWKNRSYAHQRRARP